MQKNSKYRVNIINSLVKTYFHKLNEDKESKAEDKSIKSVEEFLLDYYDLIPDKVDPSKAIRVGIDENGEKVEQEMDLNELKNEYFEYLRESLPSVRLPMYINSNGVEKCTYKFVPGVLRMLNSNQLSNGAILNQFNHTLKLLATAHADEYDENLNNLNAIEIIDKFKGLVTKNLEEDKKLMNAMTFGKSDYQVIRIPSFEDSSEFSKYTEWCVTQEEEHYNTYTSDGVGVFISF